MANELTRCQNNATLIGMTRVDQMAEKQFALEEWKDELDEKTLTGEKDKLSRITVDLLN